MCSYKLSIVVPTKNRYGYLEPLVKLVNGFSDGSIEIVIEDNSDDNKVFLPVLELLASDNLHYYYTPESISVGKNLDNGILHSQGEYVCVIGDDDGVLPSIINCVDWMEKNEVDAIIPMVVSYMWPDHDESTSKRRGVVSYTTIETKPLVEYLNPREELNNSIKNGFLNRGKLPICYHGIVSRRVLDEIYSINNQFSPGPSPDIAAGVALSLVVKKYALVNYPIIISGASRQHGGGAYRMKHGAAEIEDVPFLPSDSAQVWEKTIPKVWSVETIWPESAIKALRYMGREDLIDKVNFNKIYFQFLIRRFYYRERLYKVIRNKASFWLFFISQFMVLSIKYIIRKITPKSFSKNAPVEKDNVPTIIEASEYITSLYPSSIGFSDGIN